MPSSLLDQHVRSFLAIAEISVAMVLLVAGGLLIRSFALVTSVNPGFDPNNVTEAEVSLPQFQYSTPQQWTAFCKELLARLYAQPGLQDSALAAPLPMDRQGQATFAFSIVGNPPLPPGKSTTADYATVSPGYFHVMRIPLLRGRFFSDSVLSNLVKLSPFAIRAGGLPFSRDPRRVTLSLLFRPANRCSIKGLSGGQSCMIALARRR